MSARDNPSRRKPGGAPPRKPTPDERVPATAAERAHESLDLLHEAIDLVEEFVETVVASEPLDDAACDESARRLDPLIAGLTAARRRLANAGRERERLSRLAEVQGLEFRRVPGWPGYDVDRDGRRVRSYYGPDRELAPRPCRVLNAPLDPDTGLPTVKLCRNRGENRRIAVAALAREVWGAPGSGRDSGGCDYSALLDDLNIGPRRR